jgi:exodeoxyribonuclease V alpha subunit
MSRSPDPVADAEAALLPPGNRSERETLSGLVERVVFHNPETGFAVVRIKLPDQKEPVTLVGEVGRIAPGEVLRAAGAWQTDPSFGRQFRARSLETMPPSTTEGMEAYLASGLIKGVGRAMAKKLVARFGERLFEVIERQPNRLREVPGLGRGLAGRIVAAFKEQRAVRDIMLFLHSNGMSALRAGRIFETYGQDAVKVVSQDPYRLARDIRGIGFASADELAGRLNVPSDSMLRLRAGLAHALGETQAQGHCALPRSRLILLVADLLAVAPARVEAALEAELRATALVEAAIDGEACVYLAPMLRAELGIAEALRARARAQASWQIADVAAATAAAEDKLGLELAPGQRAALALALRRKLLVITGGPGTGKTTLVRAILEALEEAGVDVLLAAPTGRAARRLSESTGRDARTLHRLLEAEPGRGFRRNALRPLPCDLLIVDEASMVDVPLMDALLTALPEEAGLFLIGDVDQLPSVGPGQVLADLIDAGTLPVARLERIFRQAAESRIVRNAHRINRGLMPELARSEGELSDFYAIKAERAEDGVRLVRELVTRRIPERFGLDPVGEIQVLCPVNRGPLGARNLNDELQRVLNGDASDRIERAGITYALGDKVMQLENDYEREVYNGDLGRITGIDHGEGRIEVLMDGRSLSYRLNELDRLAPAYAITVHKAQGSEYPAVVLPLVKQHGRMLRRNLVYTAITRARRLVVLVTQSDALELAIEGRPEPRRWSNLKWLVQAPEPEAAGRTS